MKGKLFVVFLFLWQSAFSQSLTLLSPNGGENFTAGQQVTIRWTKEGLTRDVYLYLSRDNGATWRIIGVTDSIAFVWTVPHLKQATDQALVKVQEAFGTISDVSDGRFSIQASPNDAFEPNDDFASARPLNLGDTIKNAIVMGLDSTGVPLSENDFDFFKVTLTGGKLATVSTWGYSTLQVALELYDASQRLVASNWYGTLTYSVSQTGVYYCKVSNYYYQWTYYDLRITQSGCALSVVSPNGGETFHAGKDMTVRWTPDPLVPYVAVSYSRDNGATWDVIGYPDSGATSLACIAPPLKKRTDKALIKVAAQARSVTNEVSDVSDGNFTVEVAQPDAYEPNDGFASARLIGVGDSAVKNATIMGGDSATIDSVDRDQDFYKVVLTAGMLTTITCFGKNSGIYSNYIGSSLPGYGLYDSAKTAIAWGSGEAQPLKCNVPRSGTYYCVVSGDNLNWSYYGLSINQGGGNVTLLSPNGGGSVSAGQQVTVRWRKDPQVTAVVVDYSDDNGATWNQAAVSTADTAVWTVPWLKRRADQALVRVSAGGIVNGSYDISDGPFAIQACAPDAYEQNDDFASAYSIGLGDSVVKKAIVIGGDSAVADPASIDEDYFKVLLPGGKLATVSCFGYSPEWMGPHIELYDASRAKIADGYRWVNVRVQQPGTYFCKLSIGPNCHAKYFLSIKTTTILTSQQFSVDSLALQWVNHSYTARLVADTTKLNIDLALSGKWAGSVTTMVLAPEDISLPQNAKAKVKAISVTADMALNSLIKTADISIPYNKADLVGYPETLMTVQWLDASANQWTPITSTVDTANQRIVAHATHFSIFGVFVDSKTAVLPSAALSAVVSGISADFLPQKGIAVHFALPKAATADLRLYDVRGKCVRKALAAASAGSSAILWNLGGLGNGKYFLAVKAGTYQMKESILLMN